MHRKVLIYILGDTVSSVSSLRIGRPGFDSRKEQGLFLFATAARPALRSTRPPIQWVAGTVYLGVKRPGRVPDHSPPSRA